MPCSAFSGFLVMRGAWIKRGHELSYTINNMFWQNASQVNEKGFCLKGDVLLNIFTARIERRKFLLKPLYRQWTAKREPHFNNSPCSVKRKPDLLNDGLHDVLVLPDALLLSLQAVLDAVLHAVNPDPSLPQNSTIFNAIWQTREILLKRLKHFSALRFALLGLKKNWKCLACWKNSRQSLWKLKWPAKFITSLWL